MEPELRQAIAHIKPKERDDVAREFFKQLKKRGLSDRDLEKQLGLSTHHASRMTEDDVAKLAAFTYHSHPVLTILFCVGVVGALLSMSHLSFELVESQALQNAKVYAQLMKKARTLYSSEIVSRAKMVDGISVTHNYLNQEGGIPLPAT